MLPLAKARSCSNGVAIHYLLPVLWLTYFYSMGLMGQNEERRYISMQFARLQHQLDVKQLVFGGVDCDKRRSVGYRVSKQINNCIVTVIA